jgi:1-acyl-sn-glycerol-3-phosphate acyltransferase
MRRPAAGRTVRTVAPLPPLLHTLVERATRPLARTLFRPRVRGLEHLPAGGFLLCANHLSGFDAGLLVYALRGRWPRSMAKTELFERSALAPWLRGLGAFPASPGDRPTGGVATAARLARAGHAVVIFPEGARRRQARVPRPRAGAARAALAAGVPLVPAAIRGTDRWRRLGRWELEIGAPLALDDLSPHDPRSAAEATRRLWAAITALEEGLALVGTGRVARRRPARPRGR